MASHLASLWDRGLNGLLVDSMQRQPIINHSLNFSPNFMILEVFCPVAQSILSKTDTFASWLSVFEICPAYRERRKRDTSNFKAEPIRNEYTRLLNLFKTAETGK